MTMKENEQQTFLKIDHEKRIEVFLLLLWLIDCEDEQYTLDRISFELFNIPFRCSLSECLQKANRNILFNGAIHQKWMNLLILMFPNDIYVSIVNQFYPDITSQE